MPLRLALVALILAATAAFVTGVAVERSDEAGHHDESAEVAPAENRTEAAEEHEEAAPVQGEASEELRPLGVDVEAWPFVALAAVASMALAAVAWLNPRRGALLAVIAVAMLAFAALDIRELFHQADIDEDGLAVLAAAVAVLHLGAAAVAATMRSQSTRAAATPPGTMAA
jgi:Flp pilus assembly protein TadB